MSSTSTRKRKLSNENDSQQQSQSPPPTKRRKITLKFHNGKKVTRMISKTTKMKDDEVKQCIVDKNHKCIYANYKRKMCKDPRCHRCFEISFASHPMAKNWSPKNKKQPRNVFKQSNRKYWFYCFDCNHEFEASLNHIGGKKQTWCGFCANKKLCSNCSICFEKSFASHPRAENWSPKNKKQPRNVFKNSHEIYLFNCPVCSHEFQSPLDNITEGKWCPFCANKKICSSCSICFEKSFASHPRVEHWSVKNKNPRHIFKHSNGRYLFDCPNCNNEFEKKPSECNTKYFGCQKCSMCPSCELWTTYGKLCIYCKPRDGNKMFRKTKEYEILKYLKDNLPDIEFILKKSVGNYCDKNDPNIANDPNEKKGHMYPDARIECYFYSNSGGICKIYHIIIEVDENQHRSGADYKCDAQRMTRIQSELGAMCIFIRYNPDGKGKGKSEDEMRKILLKTVKKYLYYDFENKKEPWNDLGFKIVYLFYDLNRKHGQTMPKEYKDIMEFIN